MTTCPAPAVTDLVSGQIQRMFTGAPAVIQFVKSGQLRALAVPNSKRLEAGRPGGPDQAGLEYKMGHLEL